MTREEAINKLNWALDNNTIEDVQSAYEYIVALKLAIKALEQEPRKGHWISSNGVPYTYFNSFTICSECNKHPKEKSDFCPNCGAQMVETQKSEE